MQINDIMSQPLAVDKDSIIIDALNLMEKYNTTHILVKNQNKIIGVCSDLNIADRLGSNRLGSIATSSIRVSSIMEPLDFFISKNDSVISIADKMVSENKSFFPVGSEDKIEGYITIHNFTKLCNEVKNKIIKNLYTTTSSSIKSDDRVINIRNKLLKEKINSAIVLDENTVIGLIDIRLIRKAFASFRDVVPGKYQEARIKNLIIYDIMIKDPPIIKPNSQLSEVAKILENKVLYGLPVIENDKLMGVFYISDILSWVRNEFGK